ncbi:MAG: glycoside hydrolase family 28 protein, partial [Candidatus Hydrogenedentes bacterium]|nr:glycoside hydrolase family 28 protein [Candidatus Hydrogenedentota bacterium]
MAATKPAGAFCFSVKDFGATGDGEAKDTPAIQKAIDTVANAGGGTVYFPPGTYLSGTIYLKSRVTVHLKFGAILLGSADLKDFPVNTCAFRSYTDNYVCQALLWGENLEDIAIVGRGVIDGQGAAYAGLPWLKRPYIIRFVTCRNVLVKDVTMRNSPMWMQHYLACDQVTVQGINVYNHCNANNDMIDIDCCRDVRISDCYGDTDDDALTLKSTADRATENVVITNCVLASHCNPIKMGTESNGGFKNITITNCVIRRSLDEDPTYGTRNGLAGLALEIVDGGTMDRVAVSNLTMTGVTVPIFVRLGNRARPFIKGAPKPPIGALRNVIISDIIATDVGNIGCSITGQPEQPVENITLSNIKLAFAGGGTKEDVTREIPELAEKYPESKMFGTLPAYGFYCRHVDGLTLENIDVRFATPDYRPGLFCDDVRNLHADNFSAQGHSEGSPTMIFSDVHTALVRGCTAPST